MSTSATLPSTIHIRPSRLAGLLVAVAILTGVTTWSVSQVTTESHARSSLQPRPGVIAGPATKAYVEGVTALTPDQRAAIFGNWTDPNTAASRGRSQAGHQPRRFRRRRADLPHRPRRRR